MGFFIFGHGFHQENHPPRLRASSSLIWTLVLSWFTSNSVLSKFYFSLQRNPETDRFFRGYECAGKTIGYVLLLFGNVRRSLLRTSPRNPLLACSLSSFSPFTVYATSSASNRIRISAP
ncbi:hypothetical protein RHGRI_008840 [Rhododendron griersonianum]|uniref:Uncharacterized protein n=1 Tax=Rhododendron griersonianum TaxID=479676 RepID=A0AAV6L3A6_9ERIC|nr:hypothetical protein RHGRI_008840 [Rhododendron griersonianum]